MTKNEIIQSVTMVDVKPTDTLIERDLSNIKVSEVGPDLGGLRIIQAQNFAEYLAQTCTEFADEPRSDLFVQLHREILRFNQMMIADTIFDAVADEIRGTHEKMIERLELTANQLGIRYDPPEDPLLD